MICFNKNEYFYKIMSDHYQTELVTSVKPDNRQIRNDKIRKDLSFDRKVQFC